jgi:mono/diheme cytochrome c family protein
MIRYTLLLLAAATAFLGPSTRLTSSGSAIDTLAGPQIAFDTFRVDLGRILQGDKAQHTFTLYNTGSEPLTIYRAQPSCGCTIAKLTDSTIAPHASAFLDVIFDSKGKGVGRIGKTISVLSNSVRDSNATLSFSAVIYEDTVSAHRLASNESGRMMHLDGIFKGDCAGCHSLKGKGLYGMKLFDADCAICHGREADSKPGAPIYDRRMLDHSTSEWKTIVSKGLPRGNMPGFENDEGGPLSSKQIASIVEYLSAVKSEVRKQLDNGAQTTRK